MNDDKGKRPKSHESIADLCIYDIYACGLWGTARVTNATCNTHEGADKWSVMQRPAIFPPQTRSLSSIVHNFRRAVRIVCHGNLIIRGRVPVEGRSGEIPRKKYFRFNRLVFLPSAKTEGFLSVIEPKKDNYVRCRRKTTINNGRDGSQHKHCEDMIGKIGWKRWSLWVFESNCFLFWKSKSDVQPGLRLFPFLEIKVGCSINNGGRG